MCGKGWGVSLESKVKSRFGKDLVVHCAEQGCGMRALEKTWNRFK